jgi:hypothetical protein
LGGKRIPPKKQIRQYLARGVGNIMIQMSMEITTTALTLVNISIKTFVNNSPIHLATT